jgi:hypothetical protein
VRPVFSARFTANGMPDEVCTFSVTRTTGPTVTMSATVGNHYYGPNSGALSLRAAFAAAAPSGTTFTWAPVGLSSNLGMQWSLQTGGANPATGIAPSNASGCKLAAWLGLLGAEQTETIFPPPITFTLGAVLTVHPPAGVWFAKAHAVSIDDERPVSRQAYSSGLAGSGVATGSVVTDDEAEVRAWRRWRVLGIPAARCLQSRLVSSVAWRSAAGITSSPTPRFLALDGSQVSVNSFFPTVIWPGSNAWWRLCVVGGSGGRSFHCLEDEATFVSGTQRGGVYDIVLDPDCPVDMSGWQGLREPNLSPFGNAGGTMVLDFAALRQAVGYVP